MEFFSNTYRQAQQRFVDAAQQAGASCERLPLSVVGPEGESLAIDIAWLGDKDARQILIHCSGLHGVEGFAGAAVQLKLLHDPPPIPKDCALLLVHVLNPFGMAWLRRCNPDNVDLNRNFIFSGHPRRCSAEDYVRFDPLLNPPYPPKNDLFILWALYYLLRYGYPQVKNAVASGQYAFPKGLFYGGDKLAQEVLLYHDWLQQNLNNPEQLLIVDLHTGLGKAGQESLFLSLTSSSAEELGAALQYKVQPDEQDSKVLGYRTIGGHEELYRELFPNCRTEFITHEFGTKSVLAVINALRRENQWQHFGDGRLEHPCKQALKEAFCLPDTAWRQRILERGTALVGQGLVYLRSRH